MRWTALLLPLAAALLGAMAALPAGAQEPLSIRGRVVNGTEAGPLPENLVVLMLVNGPDGQLRDTGQTVAGPDGAFQFEGIQRIDGGSYTLSVDYGGVFYGSNLGLDQVAEPVAITIYEPTQDILTVEFERVVMVISDVDESEQRARVAEFVRVTNPTDRTLQPDLNQQGVISFMRFALPPEPADLVVHSNLRGGEVISIGTGFAYTAPVPPGSHSVDYSYTFPFRDGRVSYRQSLPQGARIFQVLTPQEWSGVAVTGIDRGPPVAIQERVFNVWEGRDIPPGPGVELTISGLPGPGVWSRLGGALTGGAFWQTAIPSAVGAVLVGLLVWGMARRPEPAAATVEGGPGLLPGAPVRQVLVREVAELDQRYDQGEVSETEYREARLRLVALALGEAVAEPNEEC